MCEYNATFDLIRSKICDSIIILPFTVGNPTSLPNVAFHWLMTVLRSWQRFFVMQNSAVGQIKCEKYIRMIDYCVGVICNR